MSEARYWVSGLLNLPALDAVSGAYDFLKLRLRKSTTSAFPCSEDKMKRNETKNPC